MNIKYKGTQPRENLLFNVKKLTDICGSELPDPAYYYLQDLVIASAQDNHNDLIHAIEGLKDTLDNASNGDMLKVVYRISGQVDMTTDRKEVL